MSDDYWILPESQPAQRSTKAEQFLGKIHGLHEYYQRLNDKSGSAVCGKEVPNYLKYFQQLLLSWVKDIQPHFDETTREFNYTEFPTVEYTSLYQSLLLLLKVSKNVESDVKEYTDGILKTLSCLVPFLETNLLLHAPVQLIGCIADMPNSTHSSMIDVLCSYILPITFGCMAHRGLPNRQWVLSSSASILLNTLQFCLESGLWMKIMECLMTYRENVRCDLLSVLAYGARETAEPAIFMLNRYFPPLDIGSVKAYQAAPYDTMPSFKCQSISCPSNNSVNASKTCLDPGFCADVLNRPPPVFLCVLCVETYCMSDSILCLDIVQPLGAISDACEDIKCSSEDRKATHFCFHPSCISKNHFKPLRLCVNCHKRKHKPGTDGENHITHGCLEDLWQMKNPEQTYLVDAIGTLLKEAQPIYQKKCMEMGVEYEILTGKDISTTDEMAYYKKISRSFHGLWLLRSLCHLPPSIYHFEHLGRLLAMLFSWTEAVAYIKHSRIIQLLKKVQEQANSWADQVLAYDPDLYCNCLLPVPPVYARVGYPWEALMSRVHQLLEGLQKISTLTKFGLMPEKVWERVMPLWMQEIKESVPVDDLSKFVVILRKLFEVEQEYYPHYSLNFIGKRLDSAIYRQKQEALVWIQMLSALEIQLDYDKLLEMFTHATFDPNGQEGTTASVFPFPDVDTLQSVAMSPAVQSPSASTPVAFQLLTSVTDGLSYYILVMDILIKQMSMREKCESGLGLSEESSLVRLLVNMLEDPWQGEHSNHLTEECSQCRIMTIFFYQINVLIEILIPSKVDRTSGRQRGNSAVENFGPNDVEAQTIISDEDNTTIHDSFDGNSADPENVIDKAFQPITSFDSFDSEGDMSSSIEDWRDKVLRYTDAFRRKGHSVSSAVSNASSSSGWSALLTAHPELQIIESLLKELQRQKDTAVLLHILKSITVFLIRGDFLGLVMVEDIDFLCRLQNIFLVPSLWGLLECSNSQLAHIAVPLILYCLSYAFGAERLSDEIESMFNNPSWRVRFSAVEKVTLMCQFLDTEFLSESSLAQSTLVNGFAHLVSAADDVNSLVAARARTLLMSLKSASLRCLYKYLELQFSQEAADRLTILRTFKAINHLMPDSSPLSGQFFLRLMKDVDVDPRHGSVVTAFMRAGSESVASDIDSTGRVSSFSKSISSPAKSSSISAARRISLSRPRSHSSPLVSYRKKYTLQFDRLGPVSSVADCPDDDTDGQGRRRRIGTFAYSPKLTSIAPEGAFLGGRVQANLDTVAEEEHENEKRASVSSVTSSAMSVQSDRSIVQQGTEREVCHELVVILLRFLANKKWCKEEKEFGLTTDKDIFNMIDHLGVMMGYKGCFLVESHELKQSAVFQAFMVNITELLDCNERIAEKFLPLCLALMIYCVKDTSEEMELSRDTLARISPHLQHSWLMTLLVFVYKFDLHEYQNQVKELILITKDTLASSNHDRCRLQRVTPSQSYIPPALLSKEGRKKFKPRKTFPKGNKDIKKPSKKDDKRYSPLAKSDSAGGGNETVELSDVTAQTSLSSGVTLKHTALTVPNEQDRASSQLLNSITLKLKEDEKQGSLTDIRTCSKCFLPFFEYGEDILNVALVVLSTFIHRAPELAAPVIMEIFDTVGRKAKVGIHSWESGGCATVPGSCSGVARQFLRSTLLQLAPKGVFQEIFRSAKLGKAFFEGMSLALIDFAPLNEMKPLECLFADFTSRSDPNDRMMIMIRNLLLYLQALPKEPVMPWKNQMHNFESFFKHLVSALPVSEDVTTLIKMMTVLVGVAKNLFKTLLPYFSQILTHVVRKCFIKLKDLQELCYTCIESFSKERDKLALTRAVVQDLNTSLKTKLIVPERNLKLLIHFILLDAQSWFVFDDQQSTDHLKPLYKMHTQAMKCSQVYTNEAIDFLRTWNFRFKGCKESIVDEEPLHLNSLPLQVKAAVGQITALRLKDQIGASKVQGRVLTWVRISPQGTHLGRSDQVSEIVGHMRTLSWILLGGLNHTVDSRGDQTIVQCVPINDSTHIADYVEVVLLSYMDQDLKSSKKNTLAALYQAFLLCEIWSVYCEMHARHKQWQQEGHPLRVMVEFWGKVTLVVLQILHRGKVPSLKLKTVTLFASTLESISGCAKLLFAQFSSIWIQVLEANKSVIPDSTLRKLKDTQEFSVDKDEATVFLREWIASTRLTQASIELVGRPRFDMNDTV